MEREANYLAVGSFVLLVLVMAALFVYWYSEGNERHHYVRYEIYFDGSVSGLSEGGQVRYLGVDVGRVLYIRIDPRAANRVQVIADIDAITPISDRTLAQLSLQGVTGLLYIDLQQQRSDDSGRRILSDVPSERYPVIRSAHSDFDLFLSSLPALTARLNELVERSTQLLSAPNVAAIQRLVANLDQAFARLPHTADAIDALVAQLRAATDDARTLIDDLQRTSQAAGPDLVAAIGRLRATSDSLERASDGLEALINGNRAQLDGFVRSQLPQLEGLLGDSRAAAEQVRDLTRSLRDNPSQLIYQPAASGVAIPP